MPYSHGYIYAPKPSGNAFEPSAESFTTAPEELALQRRQLADPAVLSDALSRFVVLPVGTNEESMIGSVAKSPDIEVVNNL